MVKRGIVEYIPITTVWEFLKSGRSETTQGGRLAQSQARRSRVSRAQREGLPSVSECS
jgi:hypothetical protein